MAIIKQNVMGAFTGKVGTLTTYNAPVGNIARIRTNSTNVGESASRTTSQQRNRVRWANLVNFYKASAEWMRKAYEGKKKGISDYNRMMALNFNLTKVALTKQEAAAGACVVDAYLVTQGSLAPVRVQSDGDSYITNIRLGELIISETTTVAEFAKVAIANNAFLRAGMQLSFVSYQQDVDDLGTPRVVCTAYEVRLDPRNATGILRNYLPEFCACSSNGYLATGIDISVGAFAYILSETRRGKTNVSTQYLVTKNDVLLRQYSADTQLERAIESYGQGGLTFLDSTEADPVDATPQPLYISYVKTYKGVVLRANDESLALGDVIDCVDRAVSVIVMSTNLEGKTVSAVSFNADNEERRVTKTVVVKNVNEIHVSAPSTWVGFDRRPCLDVTVTIDGVNYMIPFKDFDGPAVVE